MRRTKLVPHHMLGGAETDGWLPVCVGLKCVEDFGPSLKARALGLPVVGRVLDDGKLDGQGFDFNRHALREFRNPADWAAMYVATVLEPAMQANPQIEWWSGPNEQNFERDDREATDPVLAATMQASRERVMRWYGEFCWHLARLLAWRGKRAVIGGWAVGNPLKEHNLWPHWTRALQACRDWRAILERHEYGLLDGFHSLRYRWDNARFSELGYPALPVIISECGGDDVPGSGPHRAFYGTAQRFWDELLRPYALALEQDDYVLFACVFTSGQGGGGSWPGFDITGWGLTQKVVDWASSRDPLPPIGDDEMANMTPEEVQTIADSSAAIQDHAGKIRTIAAKYLPAPEPPKWWETKVPPYQVQAPTAALGLFAAPDGVLLRTIMDGRTMDVFERQGGWLRVTRGPATIFWVRAAEVTPLP